MARQIFWPAMLTASVKGRVGELKLCDLFHGHVGCSCGTAGAAPVDGSSPAGTTAPALRRSSSRIRWMTALIRARWEKACGKFPR
jgi:hypothetical protein